ncbi:MAG: putative bifunctional diguanylate cyclase/phosphodiesterase [Granulosicoccus sp.]
MDQNFTTLLWANDAGLRFWGITQPDVSSAQDFMSELNLRKKSEWRGFFRTLDNLEEPRVIRCPNRISQPAEVVTTVRVESQVDTHQIEVVTFRVLSEESFNKIETSIEATSLNHTDTIFMLFDANNQLTYRNAAALRDLPETSLTFSEVFSDPTASETLLKSLRNKREVQVEQELKTRHGSCWHTVSLKKITAATDTGFSVLMTANNSSRWHVSEQRAKDLAQKDSLTSLPNRAAMSAFLRKLTYRKTSDKHETEFGLFFLDLDRFKIINDSLGHAAGDELLIEVANRLRHSVGETGNVYRLGGDEFVVIFDGIAGYDELTEQAENILNDMSKPANIADQKLRIRPSIGICTYPADGKSITEVLEHADAAMYLAKAEHSGYCFFDAQMTKSHSDSSKKRLTLENDLITALEENQLEIYYQPKVSCQDLSVAGVEALLRWNHPERGMIPPEEFIRIAEETNHISAIGRWVLETAMKQQREWHDAGRTLPMAINISAQQFHNGDLVEHVSGALKVSGCDPDRVELEITESMLLGDTDQIQATLQQLSSMGITLALDDFGTGFSNLAYLQKYPLDVMKIDRIFLADQKRSMLMGTILNIGKVLGLTVVAEGVENSVQADWLISRGCDQLQGFYFSKPLPVEEITLYLMDKCFTDSGETRSAA